MLVFDEQVLTGQADLHVVEFEVGQVIHRLQQQVVDAFLSMQQAAREAGFNLQPASTFRSFSRQLTIWNDKFYGRRPLLDENSQPLNSNQLSTNLRCLAILHWSALPGASRHHWGTDLDIYDPDRLPEDSPLRLEPWEYEGDGYFAPLNQWISQNMTKYGFYRPFITEGQSIAREPWHLSYLPLATIMSRQLTEKTLLHAWQHYEIAGVEWILPHLSLIFKNYIQPYMT